MSSSELNRSLQNATSFFYLVLRHGLRRRNNTVFVIAAGLIAYPGRFGKDLDLLHGFGEPFTDEAGVKIVRGFSFAQERTNTAHTLEGIIALLEVKHLAQHLSPNPTVIKPRFCLC